MSIPPTSRPSRPTRQPGSGFSTLVFRLLFAALAAVVGLVIAPNLAAAQCTTCQPCQSPADCASGDACITFDGTNAFCSPPCPSGLCPGDSECYEVTDEMGVPENRCLAPTASGMDPCPAGYMCSGTSACDGVTCSAGEVCDPATGQCVGGSTGGGCPGLGLMCSDANPCPADQADGCLTLSDDMGNSASFCTCFCATDADCGPGNICYELSDNQGTVCAPEEIAGGDLCEGVTCSPGQVCDPSSGACVNDDLCATIECAPGNQCDPSTGQCVPTSGDLCEGVVCDPPAICSPATGTCVGGSDVNPGSDMSMGTDTSTSTDTMTGLPDTVTGTPDTSTGTDTSTTPPDMTVTPPTGTDTSLGGADTGTTGDTSLQPDLTGGNGNDGSSSGGAACSVSTTESSGGELPIAMMLAFGLVAAIRRRMTT